MTEHGLRKVVYMLDVTLSNAKYYFRGKFPSHHLFIVQMTKQVFVSNKQFICSNQWLKSFINSYSLYIKQ